MFLLLHRGLHFILLHSILGKMIKKLFILLALITTTKIKAQAPMYPEERTLSAVMGTWSAGITYPLAYNLFKSQNNKTAHMNAIMATGVVSILAARLTYEFAPIDDEIKGRQNVTASLAASTITITLIRIGIGR